MFNEDSLRKAIKQEIPLVVDVSKAGWNKYRVEVSIVGVYSETKIVRGKENAMSEAEKMLDEALEALE